MNSGHKLQAYLASERGSVVPSSTEDDPGTSSANESVFRLREWGSRRVHVLPEEPSRGSHIGTPKKCAIRLQAGGFAPRLVQLEPVAQHWFIRDLGRPAELLCDGVPCTEAWLRPGVEIRVGPTTLIAEDRRSAELYEFCCRLLGWDDYCAYAVDRALRAIRAAVAHRAPLVLRGDQWLVPIAYSLHRRAIGERKPFIVCNRRRRSTPSSVRAPANMSNAVQAFNAASGGSLCINASSQPADVDQIKQLLYEPASDVQLIVCVDRDHHGDIAMSPTLVDVPSLRQRRLDVPKIVGAYADDAATLLAVPRHCFTAEDRQWVIDYSARTFHEIEVAALRLLAVNVSGNRSRAAARLGMAGVSLSRWLDRRAPTHERAPLFDAEAGEP